MLKFSANLGFLWTELALPNAIIAAGNAGFDAGECHWPFELQPADISAALADSGLPMLGLNTRRGDVDAGDFGLAAIPGREAEARALIDQAVDYAAAIGAGAVHVMAGRTDGGKIAEAVYCENLSYATAVAAPHDIEILIEPINRRDVADYHLSYIEDGVATIGRVGAANLKLMFDCYHTQIMQGDLIRRLQDNLAFIGHVQIAAVPDRGEPAWGNNAGGDNMFDEVNYPGVLKALDAAGYAGYVGAEYRPRTTTDAGLGWFDAARGLDAGQGRGA